MQVAVIGGKLQGVEAVYLAGKAGWETLLIDKNDQIPAAGLCDHFIKCDVTLPNISANHLENVDLIIPALENQIALKALHQLAAAMKIPLAFDPASYEITASKIQSNHLFNRLKLPIPALWPSCGFPLIAKPDSDSGSKGVQIIHDPAELNAYFSMHPEGKHQVIQEFVKGPTFSIEVIGRPGSYQLPQVTDLFMDGDYDCKAVRAPTQLEPNHVDHLKAMALKIAETLRLKGVMDLEVVLGSEGLKILEIDARFPSQTPTAVFWSTGINMLEMLGNIYLGAEPDMRERPGKPAHVLYEHIRVNSDALEVAGEHIMGTAGRLHIEKKFFGADEALTDYLPGAKNFSATMIYRAKNHDDLWRKRTHTIAAVRNSFECGRFVDSTPEGTTAP